VCPLGTTRSKPGAPPIGDAPAAPPATRKTRAPRKARQGGAKLVPNKPTDPQAQKLADAIIRLDQYRISLRERLQILDDTIAMMEKWTKADRL